MILSIRKKRSHFYFTSNHDENSWNKSDYKTFPGPVHAPFAVFTQTMAGTIPWYTADRKNHFLTALVSFTKTRITFKNYGRAKFYKTLLELRKNTPALAVDASFKK